MNNNTPLVVPISVEALAVNHTHDDQQHIGSFSGTTTDFSQLPYVGGKSGASISGSPTGIVRRLTNNASTPLVGGIHLHWALPDTLTRQRVYYIYSTQHEPVSTDHNKEVVKFLDNITPPPTIHAQIQSVLTKIENSSKFSTQSDLLDYIRIQAAQALMTVSGDNAKLDTYIKAVNDQYAFTLSPDKIDTTFSNAEGVRQTLKNITGVEFKSTQAVKLNIYRLVGNVLMGDETEQFIIKRTKTDSRFLPAPNRWLVARLPVINGQVVKSTKQKNITLATKAWLVESDTLLNQHDMDTGNFHATKVTIPVKTTDDSKVPYRYMGVSYDINTPRPTITETSSIESLTKHPLQAVSNGEPHFSAYYPDCQNVFGFCDQGCDYSTEKCPDNRLPLSVDQSVDFQFAYAVIGWYDDPNNDPLTSFAHTPSTESKQPLSLRDIETLYQWTFSDNAAQPTRSLYFGMISDVSWNPTQSNQLAGTDLKNLNVTLANNIIESMSAWIANTVKPDGISLPLAENLLSLFQLGLSSELDAAKPDLIASLEQTLQTQAFNRQIGGTRWQLNGDFQPKSGSTITQTELGNQLNDLNEAQFAFDAYGFELYSTQFQLFSDWYRTWVTGPEPEKPIPSAGQAFEMLQGTLTTLFPSVLKPGGSHLTKFSELTYFGNQLAIARAMQLNEMDQTFIDKMLAVLNKLGVLYHSLLSFPNTQLKLIPAPAFSTPNEPLVMMAGEEITPAWRYGGDSRYDASGYLPCRLSVHSLQQVTLNNIATTASDWLTVVESLVPNTTPFASVFANLLAEACVLQAINYKTKTNTSFQTLLAEYAANDGTQSATVNGDHYSWQGELPCILALRIWQGTPWLPLFFNWSVQYYPTVDSNQYTQQPAFITTDYTLDPNNNGGRLTPTKALDFKKITDAANQQSYYGTAILSSLATRPLISQLISNARQSGAQAAAEALKTMPIVAQSLTGFNNALLTTLEAMQIKVAAPNPDQYHSAMKSYTPYIEKVVERQGHKAPVPDEFHFNPIRAGYLRLNPEQLTIVDTFGRKRPISLKDCTVYVGSPNLDSNAKHANSDTEDKYLYMPPRLTQPSRLLFNWCAASDDSVELSNVPAVTPVCGWLVADYINTSLLFFTSDGLPLGYLFVYQDQGRQQIGWQSAPGNGETIDEDLATVFTNAKVNNKFLAFAQSFDYNNNPGKDPVDNPHVPFFKTFINALRYTWDHIAPPAAGQNELAMLMSRPVVMVETELDLQLRGFPAIDQSWQGFWHDYITYQLDKKHGKVTVNTFTIERSNDGFDQVAFPLFLGNVNQLGDGMVGYFLKNKNKDYDFNTFYSEASVSGGSGLVKPTQTTIALQSSPDDSLAKRVLVIMDPRLPLHATTGILPNQVLSIPADQYAKTLRNLAVAFSMTPILTPEGTATLPTPQIAGYLWQWIQAIRTNNQSAWTKAKHISASMSTLNLGFNQQAIIEGWLTLKRNPDG